MIVSQLPHYRMARNISDANMIYKVIVFGA